MKKTKKELEVEILEVQKAILEEQLRRLRQSPAPFQLPYIAPQTPQVVLRPYFPQQTWCNTPAVTPRCSSKCGRADYSCDCKPALG